LATDIAFLQGATTYGRLRTTAINTSMLLCGSRFGRGWLRPGGARAKMSKEDAPTIRKNIALLKKDIAIINAHYLAAETVAHRFKGIGVLTRQQALELGLVGPPARSSGVALDARSTATVAPYGNLAPEVVVEDTGDCWARGVVRIREIDASIQWLEAALERLPTIEPAATDTRPLAPSSLCVSVCEGWRGEVVHCIETDATSTLKHYRVQDPSLRNWMGLAQAVRTNQIFDFPICNKSFDLSYCGSDL
jgi:Ni,Fe-hydrogenase III large subunit